MSTSIQLDVSYETSESLTAVLEELVRDTSVMFTVVQEHGPGGGNPVVEFVGKKFEILVLLLRYNGVNEGVIKESIDLVTDAS